MEFAITLDNKSGHPLNRQLYEELRRAILSCRLKPGEKVPSTRRLAESLGVSRATVTQSYEQLISEGYLQAAIGSGTTVCAQLPDELLLTAPLNGVTSRPKASHRIGASEPLVNLSRYGKSLDDSQPLEAPEPARLINFKTGRPALEEFPMGHWRRLLLRHCRSDRVEMLDYASSLRGEPELRAAIANYVSRSRAVRCNADQIIIINGSQQAIDLITKVLIDPADTVAVENPGYLGARRAFLAQGAELLPIPVDEQGIVVEKLASKLKAKSNKPVKLVYVTPSHQFPSGAVLPLARRLEMIKWAESTGAMIIEDDYDSEFRYGSRPIPALQGLAETDNVIYVGTFSKVLFPALRIGYLIVPESLARVFARARWIADRQTPTLEQRALADFIVEGHLERHLRRMRTLYDQRRQALVCAIEQHFGDAAQVLGENAGMHLMMRLHTDLNDEEVVSLAADAGVGLVSAKIYYLGESPSNEFVLGYAGLSERKIREGIRRLAKALS